MQRKNEDELREGRDKVRWIKIMQSAEVKGGEWAIRRYIDPNSLMFCFKVYFCHKTHPLIHSSLMDDSLWCKASFWDL